MCVPVCLPSVRLNVSMIVYHVCLPFCPSERVSLYVSLSVRLNFSLTVCVCLPFCPSKCVSLYVSISVRMNVSLIVYVRLPFCPYEFVSLCLPSVRLNVSLTLYVCLLFCPSECVSLYVSLLSAECFSGCICVSVLLSV